MIKVSLLVNRIVLFLQGQKHSLIEPSDLLYMQATMCSSCDVFKDYFVIGRSQYYFYLWIRSRAKL